jgi:hypothetical protein
MADFPSAMGNSRYTHETISAGQLFMAKFD